jgi:dTDP-4-dehydrorhamnose reductase
MSWYGFAEQILKEQGLSDQVSLAKGGNYVTFAERPTNSILKL